MFQKTDEKTLELMGRLVDSIGALNPKIDRLFWALLVSMGLTQIQSIFYPNKEIEVEPKIAIERSISDENLSRN